MQVVLKVGVCNEQLGNNLPSNQEVVQLYKSNGIQRMRMYAPNPQVLQALRGSDIELVLDVPKRDLQHLAIDAPAAAKWVQDNVLNYYLDVKFQIIAIGNEVNPNHGQPTAHLAPFVLLAMSKIYDAIASTGLKDEIKVSTATYSVFLSNSYPPSLGSFKGASSPFLYKNLFDAMLDATDSALEKAGRPKVKIVVSESRWPSAGGPAASVENAGTCYRNLINHVKGESPKTPGRAIETYLFAMFDENQKTGAQSEKHFGLFSPNKQPKYQLSFDQVSTIKNSMK
ncbi:hypothetical protein RHMOL_Rhmol01G0260800 [Rhododendron molle]|uniref:Uncharacterized protein n=1 Tax=Rhododendron molle TaxID=49168 RepID=A0ACC0Q626_RHOML|nr:hypothetical protein RHMOL_Rhmol01G0260800 [Rhododendron molle]